MNGWTRSALLLFLFVSSTIPSRAYSPCDDLIRAGGWFGWSAPSVIQYDDGAAYWVTWSGLYRGTHFDVQDFDPSSTGAQLDYTQYWFYHHASYPWDTASFYAELWNGDAISCPTERLDQTSMIATHYSAVTCTYSPHISTEADFWSLVNTSMSSGGWPSTLCDDGPNFTGQPHSFYSEDFIIWEPWSPGASCALLLTLEPDSWGGIKGLFR